MSTITLDLAHVRQHATHSALRGRRVPVPRRNARVGRRHRRRRRRQPEVRPAAVHAPARDQEREGARRAVQRRHASRLLLPRLQRDLLPGRRRRLRQHHADVGDLLRGGWRVLLRRGLVRSAEPGTAVAGDRPQCQQARDQRPAAAVPRGQPQLLQGARRARAVLLV